MRPRDGSESGCQVQLVDAYELRARGPQLLHDVAQPAGDRVRPRVQEDDRSVPMAHDAGQNGLDDTLGRSSGGPLASADVPADMAVTEPREPLDQAWIVPACSERHPEPWPWVDTRLPQDGTLRAAHVHCKGAWPEQGHAGVIEGVAPDEVSVHCYSPRQGRVRLGPAALHEEGRTHLLPGQLVDDRSLRVAMVRPVGVLGVKGQSDSKGGCYFSTPLMTMPRVKTRWKAMNSRTGITSVIRVPAWINDGLR